MKKLFLCTALLAAIPQIYAVTQSVNKTIAQTIRTDKNFSTLNNIIKTAGPEIAAQLNDTHINYFAAPNNQAFAELGQVAPQKLTELKTNPAKAQQFVQQLINPQNPTVVSYSASAVAESPIGQIEPQAMGSLRSFNKNLNEFIETENGIIHVIKPLIPLIGPGINLLTFFGL